MMDFKLIAVIFFASVCSGTEWSLNNMSLNCKSLVKSYPNTILDLPSYATWCGRRIAGADSSVVLGDCQTSVDWVESCCLDMFRQQTNYPVGGKPDFTKGRYGGTGYRVGDQICSQLNFKETPKIKTDLVLLFQYKCAPHSPGGPNGQGLVEFPHWVNQYENITASYDILSKNNLTVTICCEDGKLQENCV